LLPRAASTGPAAAQASRGEKKDRERWIFFFFFPNRDRLKWTEGKIGHFLVRTHLSELTNGANLTESGRNGLLVKKNLLDGLDVQYKFSVAWMSNTSFLMGCMSKARGRMHEGVAR
jgi:hypothetical protein